MIAVIRADTVRTREPLVMSQKLTDAVVKTLSTPAAGNRITYDGDVKVFGIRVTAAGARRSS